MTLPVFNLSGVASTSTTVTVTEPSGIGGVTGAALLTGLTLTDDDGFFGDRLTIALADATVTDALSLDGGVARLFGSGPVYAQILVGGVWTNIGIVQTSGVTAGQSLPTNTTGVEIEFLTNDPVRIAAFIQAIRYGSTSDDPTALQSGSPDATRTLNLSIYDLGDGGASNLAVTVNIAATNDPTVWTVSAITPATYAENAATPVSVLNGATLTVTDPDYAGGGSLTFTSALASAVLSFDAGAVTLDGANVKVGGVTVGALSGAGASVTIALNAAARNGDVKAIVEALRFSAPTEDNPPISTTVSIAFDDGDATTTDPAPITATIDITAANDGPTANADSLSTAEDATLTFDPRGNDTDPENGALTIMGASVATGSGTVTFSGTKITYDPGTNYNSLAVGETATVLINYTIADAQGATSTSAATVTVTGANDAPTLGFLQNFESGTDGILSGGAYGAVSVVSSGTGGIASPDGSANYAIVSEVGGSGPFTRFDGYRSQFVDGMTTSIQVYLDTNWAAGQGFEWSVAATGSNGSHRRDFVFHVVKDTSTGELLVGASNNANFAPREDLETIAHTAVTASGWYTLQHVFRESAGVLAVDLNLVDSTGATVWTHTLSDASDVIALIGGNRYGWFTDITLTGGLAVDNATLGLLAGRVTEVTEGGAEGAATTLSASGAIAFRDVDATDTHTVTATANGTGYVGTFTPTVTNDSTGDNQGVVGWTFSVADAAVEHLAAGQTLTQSYDVSLDDGHGGVATRTVTVTIIGSNDRPDVSGVVLGSVSEDAASCTLDLLANASDKDDGDTLQLGVVTPTITAGAWEAPIHYSVDSAGVLSLDPNQFNTLATGAQLTITFSYDVVDSTGATTPATAELTVTGVNDAPVASSNVLAGQAREDDAGFTSALFTQANMAADNRFEPTGAAAAVDVAALVSANPDDMDAVLDAIQGQLAGASRADAIAIVWDYIDDNYSYYNNAINKAGALLGIEYALHLQAGGQPLSDVIAKFAPDGGDAGTAPDRLQSLHDNLLGNLSGAGLIDKLRDAAHGGSNPAPDEAAYQMIVNRLADEGLSDLLTRVWFGGYEGNDPTATRAFDAAHGLATSSSGQLTASDVDGYSFTWSGSAPGTYGNLTVASSGAWSYALNESLPATQALAEGQTAVETFTVTVSDGHGATDTATINVTVHGANDAPTAAADSASVAEDATITGSVATNDGDVDAGASLTYAIVGAAPAGFNMGTDGAWSLDASNAAYQSIAGGTTRDVVVTYSVTDEHGASATSTLTVAVNGLNDAPTVTGAPNVDVTEDGAPVTVRALSNVNDVDATGPLIIVPPGVLPAGVTLVGASQFIDFESYALGSVVGQQGWTDASPTSPANAIVDLSGDRVLRLANDPASGDFGGPYAPTLSIPAGEAGAGGSVDSVVLSFSFRPVQSTADGSRIEIDLATAGSDRQNFMVLEHTSDQGLRLAINSPQSDGNWTSNNFDFSTGSVTLASHIDPNAWHTVRVVADFNAGSDDDVVRYYLDGVLVGSGGTFENYREFMLEQTHEAAVAGTAVNSILFRSAEPVGNPFPADGAGGNRQGFYIDDVGLQAAAFQLDPSNAAYQHLAEGQTEVVTVNYGVSDGVATTPASATFTVTGANDAPVIDEASSNLTRAIQEDGTASGVIVASDVDTTDTLTYAVLTGAEPQHGVVSWNGNQYTYTPTTNFNGSDSFTVRVSDDHGGRDDVTVTVNVAAAPDLDSIAHDGTLATGSLTPGGTLLVGSGIPGNHFTIATDAADAPGVEIGLRADMRFQGPAPFETGTGADPATYVVAAGAAAGTPNDNTSTLSDDAWARWNYTVSINADTDNNGGTLGDYVYTFVVKDLTTNATLASATFEQALTAAGFTELQIAAFNAQSIYQDSLNLEAFIPGFDPNAAHEYRIEVIATDRGNGSAILANHIDVEVNAAPVGVADTLAASEDTPVTYAAYAILGNDTDANDDSLQIVSVTSGTGGTATLNTDGTVSFIADANFSGVASFSYVASDGQPINATSAPTTVTVNVAPVSDAPTLTVGAASGNEETAITLSITAATTDPSETITRVTISNFPAGSAFSAGTVSVDGLTVTLTPGELSGLKITPPTNYAGSIDLSVTAYSQDGTATEASTTQTLTVTVAPVSDAPTLTVVNATGNEETAIALSITPATTDPSETITRVTISGFPAGSTFSAGTVSGGTLTLTPAQLSGLTITPPVNHSGSIDLSVTAYSQDGTATEASTTQTLTVTVAPVSDAPTLTVEAASGNEETAIALSITAATADPSETITHVTISNFPAGSAFSAGTVSGGTLTLTPTQLSGLTITPPTNYAEPIALLVTAYSQDGSAAEASTTQTLTVTVAPVSDAPTLTVVNATGNEETAIALSITPATTDPSETITRVTISGFPAGSTFSAGTVSGGTLTLTPAQLSGLTITPPVNHSGSIDLSVTAYSQDGTATEASTTQTLTVTVAPVSDAPTLTVEAASGNEETAIALSITAATADPSETITHVTISNFPAGSAFSAGTVSGGTLTLTPGELSGLTITPPTNYAEPIALLVTAYSQDGSAAEASTTQTLTVTVAPVSDAPTLTVVNATGNEETAIALSITPATTDPSETITRVTISGFPAGSTFSAGTVSGGTLTLTPAQLSGLTITPPVNHSGSIDLSVTAYSQDGTATEASTTQTLTVTVAPVSDAPTLTVEAASGNEETAIALSITAATADPSETITHVTISNFPAGSAFSAGTVSGGTLTLTPTQLSGLTITPPTNYAEPIALLVTAYSQDGSAAEASTTQTLTVTVANVNDAPVLSGLTPVTHVESLDDASNSANLASTLVASAAVLSDADVGNLEGGVLTVSVISGDATDRLSFGAGASVSGSNVLVGSTVVGAITSGAVNSASLGITLNASATALNVQALLRQLSYATTDDTPVASRTIAISMTDGDGGSTGSQNVVVSITATNDSPIAVLDSAVATENAIAFFNILNNDTQDPEGNTPFTVASVADLVDTLPSGAPHSAGGQANVTAPTPGVITTDLGAVVTVMSNGLVTYDMLNSSAGLAYNQLGQGDTITDTFTYQIADSAGGSSATLSAATVTVTITGVNDPVTAVADSISAFENGSGLTGSITANDTDIDVGDTKTVTSVSGGAGVASVAPAFGGGFVVTLSSGVSIAISATGAYTVTAPESLAAEQVVNGQFTYTIQDEGGSTSSSTVSLSVSGANDAPTGAPTASLTNGTEDTPYTVTAGQLLAGFVDADNGDVLSVTGLTASSGASVSPNGSGGWTITPAANYNGPITLTYTISDNHGAIVAGQTQSFTVGNVNDAPTGSVTIAGTATEDQILTASNTLADADGLGTIGYQWSRDGVAISGATGSSYTLGDADVGAAITVTASYTDGHGAVESVTSAATGAVGNVNDAPTGSVTIAGTATEDQILTASNTLADADGLGTIGYQWSRDGVAISGATGSSYTLGDADVGAAITVTASYTDGHGAVESVTSAATGAVGNVNDAPTGSVTIAGTATEGQILTASNTLADADGLGTIGYQWSRDGVAISGATGSSYTLGDADVGAAITVTASYTDGHGAVESVTSAATGAVGNVNDAPTGSVTIAGTATEDQILTASNTLADADGLGTIGYQWSRDGVAISGATGSSYTLGDADVGAAITVTASYTDGHGAVESVTSAATGAVGNVNDAPTGSVTIAGTATEDQILTASNTLADADGLGTIGYQWSRDGVAISGATGSSYTLGDADVGAAITVTASYTDGHGAVESVTSAATGAVGNVNDAPTGSVTIAGTATEDQILTASNTLADADGLGTIGYQWSRDGVAISGATGSSYTLGDADVGAAITVTASYTDGHGAVESVTSAATGAVGNVNDAPTGSVTIAGTATEGQILTASNTLADADGLGTIGYQWSRDGVAISGATGSSYTLGDADVGAAITVTASYTDGHGAVESVTSAATGAVGNVNDAPTGSVTIAGTATEDQILTASNTLADADGLGTIGYQWSRDGVAISGATGSSYTLGDADVGAAITVTASYTDGHGAVESVTSAATGAVGNVNDAPTGSVTIAGTATEDQILTASNTLADADGLGTIGYQWSRDGVAISGATGSSYTLGDADVGAAITVTASYTDGHGAVESVTSAATGAVGNVNDAPTGSVTIAGTATEDQILTASNTLADADGLGTIGYQWSRDGVAISGATGSSYTLGDADVGAAITVTASYTDGHGAVESVTSAATGAVGNVNDAPTGSVTIAGTATEDQILTASNTLADADGLGTIGYQWSRDGVAISGATGSSYTLGDADVGAAITVTASYTDGHGAVESVTSAATGAVGNVNDAPVIAMVLENQSSAEDAAVSFTLPAGAFTDADGETLTLTATQLGEAPLPAWLHFDAETGMFTGTPPANFNGSVFIEVKAQDAAGDSVTQSFTLAITPVNDAPVAGVALANQSSPEDEAVSFALPAGAFTDADGDALTLTASLSGGDPLPAWLSFDGANFTGTPPADFNGSLSITVTATDADEQFASQTFTLDITPVNDAPVAADDAGAAGENGAVAFDVLANDTDVDGDALAVSGIALDVGATSGLGALSAADIAAIEACFSVDGFGRIAFNPGAGLPGVESVFDRLSPGAVAHVVVAYTVSDGFGGTSTASLAVDVTGDAESYLGTSGDDRSLIGSAYVDVIDGLAGADVLTGLAGDDWLYGREGNDVLRGGDGADRLDGGDGFDYASYTTSTLGVVADLANPGANTNEAAGDLYTSIEGLVGSAQADVLSGDGGANTFIGGLGADTMTGRGGNDTYYVEDAGDKVIEAVGGGADVVRASVSYVLLGGVEVEQLVAAVATDTTALNLTGNEFVQRIFGNAGANNINGRGGADLMYGYGGDDIYHVDNAGDRVVETAGGGRDTVKASVDYTLAAGVDVEILATSSNTGVTTLALTGNELAQTVMGDAGANRVNGGDGSDTLYGLGGQDTFVFDTALGATNIDRIMDYAIADDTIELRQAIFSSLGVGVVDVSKIAVGAAATTADHRLVYNAATGALFYDADGSGGAAQVQFATLSRNLATTAADLAAEFKVV